VAQAQHRRDRHVGEFFAGALRARSTDWVTLVQIVRRWSSFGSPVEESDKADRVLIAVFSLLRITILTTSNGAIESTKRKCIVRTLIDRSQLS